MLDKESCIVICAYHEPDTSCQDIHLTNSVAAGCVFAGISSPGHDCDESESQDNFRNNIANSVDGSGGQIFPNPAKSSHKSCYEGSHFAAYKNTQNGLATQYITEEIIMTNITIIDNALGINIQASGEFDISHTWLRDSNIYGEAEAQDCP